VRLRTPWCGARHRLNVGREADTALRYGSLERVSQIVRAPDTPVGWDPQIDLRELQGTCRAGPQVGKRAAIDGKLFKYRVQTGDRFIICERDNERRIQNCV